MKYKQLKAEHKRRLAFERENTKMYKDLYKAVAQEHQHQWIGKMMFDDLIIDVNDYLEKWLKNSILQAYIKNARDKICLMDSIHFSLLNK